MLFKRMRSIISVTARRLLHRLFRLVDERPRARAALVRVLRRLPKRISRGFIHFLTASLQDLGVAGGGMVREDAEWILNALSRPASCL